MFIKNLIKAHARVCDYFENFLLSHFLVSSANTTMHGRIARNAQSIGPSAVVPKNPCNTGTYTNMESIESCESMPNQIHLLLFRLVLNNDTLVGLLTSTLPI